MLTLRPITTTDRHYAFVEALFLSSFPIEERRDLPEQRYNIDNNPDFTLLLAEDDGMPIGFFTLWNFGDFCYCEHFATDPSRRNKGYGGQIIDLILNRLSHPLMLEVELPDNDLARRRIDFYRRHGFILIEHFAYTQPPYRPDDSPLPLHLMIYNPKNTTVDLNKITATIHTQVYPTLH